MRLNFKKIAAIGMSAMAVGMTMGVAAAAAAPQPFVSGSTGDFAVVYGASAPSGLDQAQATSVANWLQDMTSSSISVEGGEAFKLDKASDHFNFNEALSGVYSNLDSDEMDFLADGSYDDGDIDVDYSQSIDLSDKALSLFTDPDYNDDAPTIGFWWTNGENILNYTIEFDDAVNTTQMVDTDMPFLGSSYYVLDASNTQVDILDTSEKHTLAVGESTTVSGKEVTLTYVDGNSAKFTVDGEATDDLTLNNEFKLSDDSYIVVTDVSYQDYAGGIQSAEFALGSGKIELISGEEAELNTEDIDGLEVSISNSSVGTIDSISLVWKSDRDTFFTEDNSISLPEFGTIKLAFGGMTFPSAEDITVDNGDTLMINMGNYNLPLMWYDSATGAALGEENNPLKLTESSYTYAALGYANTTTVWWNGQYLNATGAINDNTVVSATALNVSENDRILVTGLDDSLTNVETLYYEITTIDVDDSNTFTVELEDLIGSDDLKFTNDIGDTDDHGDVTVTLSAFDSTNTSVLLTFTPNGGQTIKYDTAISDKGMVITLPEVPGYATNGTGATLTFREANKDDDLNGGRSFTATVKNTSNDKLHVSTYNLTAYDEKESDDHYIGYVPSDLASKITFDTSADEYDFDIEYYGEEVTADVQVVAGGTITSDTPSLGGVLVKDSEVSSVQSRNLVVIGGSCINTVAANLVGGTYCESGWTDATSVGEGQFLIQSFGNAYTDGKIALLVAGYDAADTAAAASRLMNQPGTVDTTAGNKYLGVTGSAGTSTLSKVA